MIPPIIPVPRVPSSREAASQSAPYTWMMMMRSKRYPALRRPAHQPVSVSRDIPASAMLHWPPPHKEYVVQGQSGARVVVILIRELCYTYRTGKVSCLISLAGQDYSRSPSLVNFTRNLMAFDLGRCTGRSVRPQAIRRQRAAISISLAPGNLNSRRRPGTSPLTVYCSSRRSG